MNGFVSVVFDIYYGKYVLFEKKGGDVHLLPAISIAPNQQQSVGIRLIAFSLKFRLFPALNNLGQALTDVFRSTPKKC